MKFEGLDIPEGYISRQLLFFTNSGLLFQCSAGRFLEIIAISPAYYQPFDLGDEMFDRLLGAEAFMEERIGKCICEFSYREFTHDDDVLAAFRGIFVLFKQKPHYTESLCGVTLPNYSSSNTYKTTPIAEILSDLMWSCRRGTPPATAIKGSSYLTLRRTQFPSWTCARWRFTRANTGNSFQNELQVSIAVVFHHNAVMDWKTNYKAIIARKASGYQPVFIRLHAWSFDVVKHSLLLQWNAFPHRHTMTLMSTTNRSVFELWVVDSNYPETEILEILHKVVLPSESGGCLLLRKCPGEAYFERVATGFYHQRESRREMEVFGEIDAPPNHWSST